ncbi:MAG: TolC family protein [Burkholderiales bacterium]
MTKVVVLLLGSALLAGCATFSEDGGFGTVQRTVKERTGQEARWARTEEEKGAVHARTREILRRPLSADDAAQLALLNNLGLQATYAELGISEADLVQAGRMTNPHFAYLRTRQGDEKKLEWALTFPIVDLLTMPLRTKLQGRRFEEAKLAVAAAAVGVALDARQAWHQAVAAEQTASYMAQVKEAAEASAELARRMTGAGNFPKLTLMREQAFYAEAVAQLARARQAAVADRERLARVLGVFGEDLAFQLPARLPDLPATLPDLGDVEAVAIQQRLDVQAAKRSTEALAESLGLSKATRFINALEFGPASTREGADAWKRGYEISLELPIFDWGGARVAKAEAIYMQSVHRVAETAVNARSEVRESYSAYRTAYDTAKHYRDEIVPLRKRISEETLLRYNGMLMSVFELLADAREQVASVNAAIEAQRDYWLAENALQAALNGAPPDITRGLAGKGGRRMVPNPALAGH